PLEDGRQYPHLVRSDDGAKTFGPPVEIGRDGPDGAVLTSMRMHNLFVAPDGDLFASWLDDRAWISAYQRELAAGMKKPELDKLDYIGQLRVARSSDGGRSFAGSTLVEQPVCGCCGTRVAQGKDGPVFATTRSEWAELKGSVDAVRDIFVAASNDDGASWSKPVKVADDGFKISGCPDITPGLAVGAKGRLHAAWYTGKDGGPGVYYAVSDDDGKTFSKPLALLTDEWVPYGDVKLALDELDNAWVAFEDRRGDEDLIVVLRIGPDGAISPRESWPGTGPDITAIRGSALVTYGAYPQQEGEDYSYYKNGGVVRAVLVSAGAGGVNFTRGPAAHSGEQA
ncbi:MAG: sialidase family protein, partial [Actinomycetes bacterium]